MSIFRQKASMLARFDKLKPKPPQRVAPGGVKAASGSLKPKLREKDNVPTFARRLLAEYERRGGPGDRTRWQGLGFSFDKRQLMALLGFTGIFALLFLGIIGGAGQYWDWSFPLFQADIPNLFFNNSQSWTTLNGGGPLSYSSDYLVRLIMASMQLLQPEVWRYLLFIFTFSAGSYGVFLITRRYTDWRLAWLFGLLAMINIALFYKYTAGHFNYVVSYVVFIFLVHYLLHFYKGQLRHILVAGLLFALIGAQIQFFIIAGVFLLFFWLLRRDVMKWWHLLPILALTIFINMVWITNFITGAASANDTAAAAAAVSVKGSVAAEFINVFGFSFSKATLMTRFFSGFELALYSLLPVVVIWLCARKATQFHRNSLLLFGFLLFLIFMATGMFTLLPLGPLKLLFPMLREVGHFAPLIVLMLILLLAMLLPRVGRIRLVAMSLVIALTIIAGVRFVTNNQAFSFAEARERLASFKRIQDMDDSTYRILAYPFFESYQMQGVPQLSSTDGFPLSQAGHDSFLTYSNKEFLPNNVPPHKFKDSPQYKLLKTYDVEVLRPYGVKYIYNLSHVYQSHYNIYVPSATYDGDSSLIKNDPEFMQKILQKNPGKVRQINDRVLEITNAQPRTSAASNVFAFSSVRMADASRNFLQHLDVTPDYHVTGAPQPFETSVEPLFANTSSTKLNSQDRTITNTIPASAPNSQTKLYINNAHVGVFYELQRGWLTIFTRPTGNLELNDVSLIDSGEQPETVIWQRFIGSDQLYARLNESGALERFTAGDTKRLGELQQAGVLKLYRGQGGNVISNSSFETAMWDEKVGDCNNYDKKPQIAARLNSRLATDGNNSLQLEAARHDACMSVPIKLTHAGQYVLSFDYQSPNAHSARFHLGYNKTGVPDMTMSLPIYDDEWMTASELIQVQPGVKNARLYVYALESRKNEPHINRFDNFSLMQLEPLEDVAIQPPAEVYSEVTLPKNQNEYQFTFKDDGFQYTNVLHNGSFEQGMWQKQVSDCNEYDNAPRITAQLTHEAAEGKQALRMQAAHHDACTFVEFPVKPGASYRLSFKYKANKGVHYGTSASFDTGFADEFDKKRPVQKTGWQTFTKTLVAPDDASSVKLYLYAFETDGHSLQTVTYDDVAFIEMPRLDDRFYLLTPPTEPLDQPATITVNAADVTSKTITITGAQKPFILRVSETYHPGWKLRFGEFEVAKNNHKKLNNFSNAWYVNPARMCAQPRSTCAKNSENSYTLRATVAFAPQQPFLIGLNLSAFSLGAAGWLVVAMTLSHRRAQRRRND